MRQVVPLILFFVFFSCASISACHSNPFPGPFHFLSFLSDTDPASNLRVYPNPAINYFEITPNRIVSKLSVFDLIGKKVKTFSYEAGNKYFVGDLRKGIYLVQFLDEQNNILVTKRISKE